MKYKGLDYKIVQITFDMYIYTTNINNYKVTFSLKIVWIKHHTQL